MAKKSVYEQIKKQNGEHFAQAIQNYDNGIFDVPGIVDIVRFAGREAEPIMEYLESLKKIRIEETGVYQDPLTLLDLAGYNAYYVTNLEEQNRIKHYYASAWDLMKLGVESSSPNGERLCTFNDPDRFKKFHIVNAVRKDVDKFRREDFVGKEERDKDYGISVLSIQILKTGGSISIKNRYNHTVENPDDTLGSNPDNIIPGLASALRHHFQTDFSSQAVPLPEGYTFLNGQIIRYNYEKDNIYFGPDFYVKEGQVHHLKPHEIMLDTYIFDLRTKKLTYPASGFRTEEDKAFKKAFLREIKGHKIIFKKDKTGQHLFIRKKNEKDPAKDIEILTVKNGCITVLNLPTTKKIGNYFLSSTKIESFNAPNLVKMGDNCFVRANSLGSLNIPALRTTGNSCFRLTNALKSLDAPALIQLENDCFQATESLKVLNLPNLKEMGEYCFHHSEYLEKINLPNIVRMGSSCFFTVPSLKSLDLQALTYLGNHCFREAPSLESLNLPQVKKLGSNNFAYTKSLNLVSLPPATEMGRCCFYHLESLGILNLPVVSKMEDSCFGNIRNLRLLHTPALKEMGEHCFYYLKSLNALNLPAIKKMGPGCFRHLEFSETLYAPLLKEMPNGFLSFCLNRKKLLAHRNQSLNKKGLSQAFYLAQGQQASDKNDQTQAQTTSDISGLGQTNTHAQPQNQSYSFFRKLREWILPRQ